MIDSFKKILIFETPIEKFFDAFVSFFESAYGPFYVPLFSIQKQYTIEQINKFMKDSNSLIGNFMTVANFFTAFNDTISKLIDYNLNDSMKNKLVIAKEKCLDVVRRILVFSPHYDEFKSIIENHKIVYDIEFDISQLPPTFYQVFVNIVDSDIEIFSPEKRLNKYYLICSDEIILVASVDSDEVHFLFAQSTSKVFCEKLFDSKQSKLTLFTLDGMIEFEQIDLTGDKLKILYNIGQLIINKINELNNLFEDQWNLQKKSDINSEELININISHVDITMHVITYHFKYDRKADIDKIKEIGKNQISQNLYKTEPNNTNMLFYL